ncbi:DegV family protein [Weissella diestrammenae]|uniref:DegV family protein n=1 Tax=Weissella diestrammenae TaxID=1162633 RepID=A0A7G9T4X8_9LACO|nr:DegV family protein [Weissella diestrammenae]MCM0582872.1 DegV family protein [Weissella diestrammenae]QNN75153.1 DegV family protein [Weissella diestrammenae]
MSKVKIVTDSTAVLTTDEIEALEITVVPLTVMIDDVMYEDGVTITREDFMDKMAVAKNLPKTSTPSIGVFTDEYERLLDDDSEIISIHLTPGLSGTFNTAQQAAQLVHSERIHPVDSKFIDRAQSFQVIRAARMAQAGASVAEILADIEQTSENTELYLTLSSLDNLTAGGRISKATGFIGGLLNIKIGAHVVDGEIEAEVKGRGSKTTKNYLDKILNQMHDTDGIQMIGLSHAGIPDEAEAFAKRLREEFPDAELMVQQTTPTVATHTGVGAFGFSYLKAF